MLKKIGKILLILYIILLLGINNIFAGDIAIESSVSSTEVAVGEQFTYSVTISGSAASLPRPSLSPPPSFKVYSAGTSSSFQFVNGAVSSSVTYNYAMIPTKVGTFTIGPAQLKYKGKVYQTSPINIKVVKQKRIRPQQRQQKNQPSVQEQIFNQRETSEIFVRAIANKHTVYVNEPVIFSYKLYFKNISISQYGIKKMPDFTGFWVEDIPPKLFRKQRIELYNGRKYYTLILERRILFPTSPGRKNISSTTFNFIVQDFFSFFGKRVERKANPVSFKVLPLPSNKPKDFNGSVGVYNIKYSLSTKKIKQNTPFSLKIIISGTGNIKSISKPIAPDFKDFKVYDTHSSINVQKTANSIQGSKVFEYILIPLSAGNLTIDSFKFSYFNYKKRKYVTIKTKPIKLKSLPGPANTSFAQNNFVAAGKEVKLIGKDIRFIKENVGNIKNQGTYYYRSKSVIFLVLLPLLILLTAYIYARYLLKLETDVQFAKATRAYKMARKIITTIDKKLNKNDLKDIDSLFEKLLINYISDKFNIPKSEIVISNIKKLLKSKNIKEEVIKQLEELYEESNLLRYAPTKPEVTDYRDLLNKAISIFNNIERSTKKIEV